MANDEVFKEIDFACRTVQKMFRRYDEDTYQDLWVIVLDKKLVNKYDPSQGVKLNTFITHCLKNFMIIKLKKENNISSKELQMSSLEKEDEDFIFNVYQTDADLPEILEGLEYYPKKFKDWGLTGSDFKGRGVIHYNRF